MRIHRVIAVSVFIVSSLLLCFSIGCSGNGTDGDGGGNGEVNGDSAIVGEIIGILTYVTTYDYNPPDYYPVPRTTLENYSAAIEDKDGNILLLSAPGMSSDFEYDGMSLLRVTTTVAGYTYADEEPFNDESRDVGGKLRVISHTGIHVSVTGEIDTFTGYIGGDAIEVATIEEAT